MKRLAILGVSGSIGRQCVEVINEHPDEFTLIAISVYHQLDYAIQLVHEMPSIRYVAVKSEEDAKYLQNLLPLCTVVFGEAGLIQMATLDEVTLVVNALVGFVGMVPTIRAIEHRKDVALANKETLVVAGHLIMKLKKDYGVNLYPIDSEHSAITQCLVGEKKSTIENLILTASGGPFFHKSREELQDITVSDALKHPNWSMGAKITIDSATLVNKGLEIMEAHWLFDLPYEQIQVLIHPQSIVHSMVEFSDGAIKAQLGIPSMKIPIAYALFGEQRLKLQQTALPYAKMRQLDFYEVDLTRFKSIELAYQAGKCGGSMPCVYNAANEVANQMFREGKVAFTEIETLIEKAMEQHIVVQNPSLEELITIDQNSRDYVAKNM